MTRQFSRLRDALALTGGLARVGWALATERTGEGPTATPLPTSVISLDAAWITHALRDAYPGARVDRIEHLDGHAGTTTRVRLGLTFGHRGAGPPPPLSVFVKLAPPDLKTRLFCGLMGLGATEVRFYREIAPHLPASVEVPRVYHAAIGPGGQRFALVLEDLTAGSADFTDISRPVTAERARGVMSAFARLHATFWDSPRLHADLAWLRRSGDNPNLPVERLICAAGVARAVTSCADLIPPAVRQAASRIVAARNQLEAAWAQGSRTLIHGDSHVGNLYFTDGRVGFLDWQVTQCGQGMRDVAYFLINSLPTALRRSHERALITHYLDTLSAQGVRAPGADEAWAQYRLHAFYTWIAAAVAAAAATLQQTAVARAGLARAGIALMDVEALDVLPGGE
jgi:aminoglycoside phosphotransferase (APT) family kinase protein